jgi:hypothetical protein
MEKITLKLFEFYSLDVELNGFTNPQSGEKQPGLLQEKLPLVTKYWLTDLAKKAATEKAAVEELKNDLIKKHGKPAEDGSVSIPMVIDGPAEQGEEPKKMLNPDYVEFEKEFAELLQTEKEIKYQPISLKDLAQVETAGNYPVFFKLVLLEQTPDNP